MIHTNATVRETAKKFGISKSTVHTVVPIGVGFIGYLHSIVFNEKEKPVDFLLRKND